MILRPAAHRRRNRSGPLLTIVAALTGLAILGYVVVMVLVINSDDTVAPFIPDPIEAYHGEPGERPPQPDPPPRLDIPSRSAR